ncbi:MAG: BTAD domain-containing putative transcriptional regulator [Bacteroidota bacterium]
MTFQQQFTDLLEKARSAPLHIRTLGGFVVVRDGDQIDAKSWGRDKTLQLLQYLITVRHRNALHKEQIISRIWEDVDQAGGDRDFKVAMHGINKALEPNRKSRSDAKYIIRQGSTYQLALSLITIDVEIIEMLVSLGNQALQEDHDLAIEAYREALSYHKGLYLPNRVYDDWSSEERERIQILILGAYISLAELTLDSSPQETIRLCQRALEIDHSWEDAYRLMIRSFIRRGNRPAAIKTYRQCQMILDEEYGIDPLPQTQRLMDELLQL